MKQYGYLQTFSAVDERRKENIELPNPLETIQTPDRRKQLILPPDPLRNFGVVFIGPENLKIFEKISGASNLPNDLLGMLMTRIEYGWRPIHFFMLNYFCKKYDMELAVTNHEYKVVDTLCVYESILFGNWKR